MTTQRQHLLPLGALLLALILALGCGWLWLQYRQAEQALAQDQREIDALMDDKARLQSQLTDLETRSQSLKTSLNDYNQQQASLGQVVEELRRELTSVTSDYQRLSATQDTTRERLTNAQSRLSRLSDLETTNADLVAERDRLNHQVDRLTAQNRALRDQLTQYASHIEQAQTALVNQRAQVDSLEDRLGRERDALKALQAQLDNASQDKQAEIEQRDNGSTVIKLPERILFESGSAVLTDQAETVLSEVARAIDSFPGYTIAVLGHSDSRPVVSDIKQRYPTNWELSSARASAAVRVLIDDGIAADRLKATGLADTRPLVPETDDASRRKNRRIEIVLEPPREVRGLERMPMADTGGS